ncbi:hypothetical protein GCM10023165_52940 [Variovorax defluvii]|uniref:Uncharacterized protein n=1 Tax=Variovorax defluvii TaxID=913761 RepID=A0ABP8IG74_9BURK
MAFDPETYTALDAAPDFATVTADHISASLLTGAFTCIAEGIDEWESHDVMPSEEVFREVEPLANNEEPIDPETAATFLLLVREALRD